MRAIVSPRYGPPEALQCEDVGAPTPVDGEALVRVIPKPLRIWSVRITLAVLPLAAMLYRLWRIRVRRSLRDLVLLPQGLRGAEAPNV